MPENNKIAIVILNWNGEKLFPKFLPSVIRNSKSADTQIYVADNGSTDNSVKVIKEKFPEVSVIELQNNYGFAEGYNQALKNIDATFFILLNSDVEVTPNWITPCIKMLEEDEYLAAIQPKILSYEKPHQLEYAGAAGGFIDMFGYPFCRGRILNQMEADLGQYNTSTPIFWASGACMFIKADVFKKAGGFDGDFWAHMEEIDLCWRLKNQGFKIAYQPESVVFHLGGGTLSYDSPQKVYLNFRNNLFVLFKNLPRSYFFRIFFARMVLDGVAAVNFLVRLYFHGSWAVLKAHVSFYRNLGKLIKKRKSLLPLAVAKHHPEVYRKSIMWNFFIQRKSKFSELNFNPEK
ncbi:Glycosyltransferase, GT2 family [Mariniphaga anaerophila]|uniref:Glycosyltransferase, GT2 family n=1 Tax=Mariniphaga anaerophila TaxID=1484053 RepID=A0A1M4Y7U0_9BACT|nr:glycosyltransferase family 2 protein [Mariniphaga anaerophila]SHF01877.1 Glycosyltransferase, GT2 family [Mariniphaga anaerophila]